MVSGISSSCELADWPCRYTPARASVVRTRTSRRSAKARYPRRGCRRAGGPWRPARLCLEDGGHGLFAAAAAAPSRCFGSYVSEAPARPCFGPTQRSGARTRRLGFASLPSFGPVPGFPSGQPPGGAERVGACEIAALYGGRRKDAKTRQENVSFWLAHRLELLCALGFAAARQIDTFFT